MRAPTTAELPIQRDPRWDELVPRRRRWARRPSPKADVVLVVLENLFQVGALVALLLWLAVLARNGELLGIALHTGP